MTASSKASTGTANAGRNQENHPGSSGDRSWLWHYGRRGWFSQDDLGLFHEHGCSAHIQCAILAVKQVLLELIPDVGFEFV